MKYKSDAARGKSCAGFTLLEMIVTVGIVIVVASFGLTFASRTKPNATATGERVLSDLSRIVITRLAQARQINTASRVGGTSLEQGVRSFDITVDFARPETTRSLVLDGVDADDNSRDDYTGDSLSKFEGEDYRPTYEGSPLSLPAGWSIAFSPDDLRGIPLIAGGTGARGLVARCVTFGSDGTISPAPQDGGACVPGNSLRVTDRGQFLTPEDSPFYAIYAVFTPPQEQTATAAVALAVYFSGYTESFRWDGTNWIGFNGRTINAGSR